MSAPKKSSSSFSLSSHPLHRSLDVDSIEHAAGEDAGAEDKGEEEDSLVSEFTAAWNLKKSEMETIQEELHLLAFENRAYGGFSLPANRQGSSSSGGTSPGGRNAFQQDSGFEESNSSSSRSPTSNLEVGGPQMSYENILQGRQQMKPDKEQYQNVIRESSRAGSGFSGSDEYENIKAPSADNEDDDLPEYQNVEVVSSSNFCTIPRQKKSSRKSRQDSDHVPSIYQNIDFVSQLTPNGNNKKETSRSKKKLSLSNKEEVGRQQREEEESPIYENYDFGEQSVYQNAVVHQGKVTPINSKNKAQIRKLSHSKSHRSHSTHAISSSSRRSSSSSGGGGAHPVGSVSLCPQVDNSDADEVYAQVRFLRKSVQEVNALLEAEDTPRNDKGDNRSSVKSRDHSKREIKKKLRSASTSQISGLRFHQQQQQQQPVVVPNPPPNQDRSPRPAYKSVQPPDRRSRSISAVVPPTNQTIPKNNNTLERKAHFKELLSRFDNTTVVNVVATTTTTMNVSGNNGPASSRKLSLPATVNSSSVVALSQQRRKMKMAAADNGAINRFSPGSSSSSQSSLDSNRSAAAVVRSKSATRGSIISEWKNKEMQEMKEK